MASLITRDNDVIYKHSSYITRINTFYKGKEMNIKFKLDTGASRTVISLDHFDNEEISDILKLPDSLRSLQDATGHVFTYKEIVVDNFRIAEGFAIPKIMIGVTNAMEQKALLGYDILSLFSLRYDARPTEGVWYILDDFEKWIEDIFRRNLDKDSNYLDPKCIAEVELKSNEDGVSSVTKSNAFGTT